MSAPTPISQDPSDIAYEFLGYSPAAIGTVNRKAAPASHAHPLGRTLRQTTGFGMSQTLSCGALASKHYAFLVSAVGALPALPTWTLDCWIHGATGIQTGVGFWAQAAGAATPEPVPGPVGYFTDVPPTFGFCAAIGTDTSAVFGDGSNLVVPNEAGWALYSLAYNGSTFYVFVNGVLIGTHASSSGAIPAGWLAGVGAFADNNNGGTLTVTQTRISNVPRYTASFTPPTTPYQDDSATVALWGMNDTPLGTWIDLPNDAAGWGWTPRVSGDASGNGIDLGASTYGSGTGSLTITCQVAGVTPEDGFTSAYAVLSLQARTGDLVLTDTAGNSVATAVPQTDGTTQLQTSLMAFKAAWSSTTAYAVGDTVTSGGLTYVCIANNTNNEPPNTTYWAAVGGGGGGTLAHTYEQEITVTTAVTALTYTPTTSGLFRISFYFRVTTAATDVTVTVTTTDATGAQTWDVLPLTSEAVGSYQLDAITVAGTAGDAIDVVVTAGTANQVYFSSSIEAG